MVVGKLRVDITYKNGNKMFYENVSRIEPLQIKNHSKDMVLIQQDLSKDEMEDYGLDPNEDDDWINIKINMNDVREFVITTHESTII